MKPKPGQSLGDAYHEATKYRRPGLGGVKPLVVDRQGPTIPLPEPTREGGKGLWETIAARRSIRDFDPFQPLTQSELSQLLWATQGLTSWPPNPSFRASPSAGALHPLDTYLVVNRVAGLAPGIYKYEVESAEIRLLAKGDYSQPIAAAVLGQTMAADCSVVFVWVGVPSRSKSKYRDRAHRYLYIDAGHIGGQLYLAAVALGLGCCAIGAFLDDEVNALVGVDGETEMAVYLS
ncbi:MAG: SagB/ThcOx family dehydrogenase, partial [Candidatus Zipacnadales bacterium]